MSISRRNGEDQDRFQGSVELFKCCMDGQTRPHFITTTTELEGTCVMLGNRECPVGLFILLAIGLTWDSNAKVYCTFGKYTIL